MKFKLLIFSLSFLSISQVLFAKPLIDSIGVKNDDGKKVIIFKIKAKDTYYSIGRRYHVAPKEIMKYNGSKKETLSIGATISVPTEQPYKKQKAKEKEREAENVAHETKKEKKARLAKEAKEARAEERRQKEQEQEEKPVAQQIPNRVVQQPVQTQTVPDNSDNDNLPTTQYKVSAGETLYGISKRFNTTVDDITKLNNLKSTTLIPGQMLLVRTGSANPKPQPPPQQQPVVQTEAPVIKSDSQVTTAPYKDSSSSERHLNPNKFGLYEKTEKGVGTWIDDPNLDSKKMLVLHRFAPIGTVIKITNPMTNRTAYVKVVGRFNDNEENKDVIIVMTKNVADSLGALDKRFRVIITYGSPNE